MSGVQAIPPNGAGALAASLAASPSTGGQEMMSMMMFMSSGDDDDEKKSTIMFASMSMGQQGFQASVFAAMDGGGAMIGSQFNMTA